MKVIFLNLMLSALLSGQALAFDVSFKKVDSRSHRILVESQTDDVQFLSAGDALFLSNGTRYLKVEVLRITNQNSILLKCPAGDGCSSMVDDSLSLYRADELPAAVNRVKEDQEVFHDSDAIHAYGKNLEEIGRYIQSEVNVARVQRA